MHTVDHIVEKTGEPPTASREERWTSEETGYTEQPSRSVIGAGLARVRAIPERNGLTLVHSSLWIPLWTTTVAIVHTVVDNGVDTTVVARRSRASQSR